jgi:hypothetical protein
VVGNDKAGILSDVGWSFDGKYLACVVLDEGAYYKGVSVYEIESLKNKTYKVLDGYSRVVFHPFESMICTMAGKKIILYDYTSKRSSPIYTDTRTSTIILCFSLDGESVLISNIKDDENAIECVYYSESPLRINKYTMKEYVTCASFLGPKFVALGNSIGQINICSYPTFETVYILMF